MEEAQEFLGVLQGSTDDTAAGSQAKLKAQLKEAPKAIGTVPPAQQFERKRPRVITALKRMCNVPVNVPNVWSVMIGFDGGSRGNPGVAGSGAEVIVLERTRDGVQRVRTKYHLREYLDASSTNNMAEWKGALIGLGQVVDHVQKFTEGNSGVKPEVDLVLQGDSQLVIRQLEGRYKVNNATLKRYKTDVDDTIRQLKGMVMKLKISFQHVYRSDNGVADRKWHALHLTASSLFPASPRLTCLFLRPSK